VALILGHARHLDLVKQALDWGFSSVMFDGSFLPLANNVELTARAVTLAARAGVRLEGAIGAFSDFGKDSTGECLICALAAKFARETGIDSLAVSLPLDWGRGVKLDMELLAKLCQSVTVGLSLHDASLLALQDIRGAMAAGVSRLSFDTCLRKAATENLREQSASWLREVVRQTMRLFRQESHGTPNAP
jgi:fructose/tagatose bisphosphate aldolase